MAQKIKCDSCRFARPDPKVSDKHWTAYECGNPSSEFHKALLNIDPNGNKQDRVTWGGCAQGKRRDAR